MVRPPLLREGDRIAIISPATVVRPEYIDGAVDFLIHHGLQAEVMPHAKGAADGSFAASHAERLSDLTEAFSNPDYKAVLCARGGYGCNHLLAEMPPSLLADNPKWLIGFSDVSALHAAANRAGVISLHAPMAKHLATLGPEDPCSLRLVEILKKGLPLSYEVSSHPLNVDGRAEGTLVGGNLAVISGLADTPWDPLRVEGPKILFIEDISEAIYAVERMLIRLLMSERIQEVRGIVAGRFTDYRPDKNHPDMETMISHLLMSPVGKKFNGPVALGFPAGHVDENLPLPLGADASLTVRPDSVSLRLV